MKTTENSKVQLRWSDIVGQKEYFDLIEGDLFIDSVCKFNCVKDFYHNGITIKVGDVITVVMK